MAFNASTLHKTVFGNLRVTVLSCTADAASGAVDVGLESVKFAHVTPVSLTSGLHSVTFTSVSGVSVAGVANGDVFYVTAYGS